MQVDSYRDPHWGSRTKSILEFLISKYPKGLHQINKYGNLPIHHARHDEKFLFLAEHSLHSAIQPNNSGHTAIATWLRSKNLPECRVLVLNKVLMEYSKAAPPTQDKMKEELAQAKEECAQAKESLAYEKKMALEARKIEKAFRAELLDPQNENAASIEMLRSFARSLKTRVDLTKTKLQPHSKPSMMQIMFPSFIKDPEVSRSALIDCINMFDAELSSLEEASLLQADDQANEAAVASGGDGETAHTSSVTTERAGGDSEQNSNKRARVSLS